jgi:hypothetical protein
MGHRLGHSGPIAVPVEPEVEALQTQTGRPPERPVEKPIDRLSFRGVGPPVPRARDATRAQIDVDSRGQRPTSP